MQGFSEKGLIYLIVAGAKERRQIYKKLREMEAERRRGGRSSSTFTVKRSAIAPTTSASL